MLLRIVCVLLGLWGTATLGCGPGGATPPRYNPQRLRAVGEPLDFEFVRSDGPGVSSAGLRGRVTALLMTDTSQVAGQWMLLRLRDARHRVRPRINVAAVVMEPPNFAPLLSAFEQTLGLDFPLALADYATLHGRGSLGDLLVLPTLIILDRQGREVGRHQGVLSQEELERLMNRAQ